MTEKKKTDNVDYGDLRIRGGRLEGRIVSAKAKNTAIVERDITRYFSKYKRYARERSHIAAHIPSGLEVNIGDKVVLGETRKISKTKSWVIIKVIGA